MANHEATTSDVASGHPRLSSLLHDLVVIERIGDATVTSVVSDSRLAIPGSLFLAMPGLHVDGHDFILDAVARGASAVVVERRVDVAVAQVVVPSVAAAAGPLAAAFYGLPSHELDLVGVTGTNGKTTTCQLLRACLGVDGRPVGQVGTTGVFCGSDTLADASLSTPAAIDLQRYFTEFRRRGTRRVAMEVTSHGLHQHRVDGVHFRVGIFLNLTPEHLDYHGTMDRYFDAKATLFDTTRCEAAIVCVDDEWGRRLAQRSPLPVTTFGTTTDADVVVETRSRGLSGITVRLRGLAEAEIRSPLVGVVNGSNVAAAFLAARALGVDADDIVAAIEAAEAPPGRFEVVSRDEPYLVVADYAHTPDALARLIEAAREVTRGRVHVLFGARGGRYVDKRPLMTREAMSADSVWLTSDSPGDEDPHGIVDHLVRGVAPGRDDDVTIEIDRATAIRRAVQSLEPGDTLLMTGRGPETRQRFADRFVTLDDRVEARLALDARRPAGAPAPEIAVVVAAHDAAHDLADTLRAVLSQTTPVDEVVVVDDGSDDDTLAVAQRFGARVRVVHQPRLGSLAAANLGAATTRARWVAFAVAGEMWFPRRLEWQLDACTRSGAQVCVGVPTPGTASVQPSTERVAWSSLLIRRDAFGRIGGFDVDRDARDFWDRAERAGVAVTGARDLLAG